MLHRAAMLMIALAAGSLGGCISHHDHTHLPPGHDEAHRGHGPPPHAPAHGYRHKHHAHTGDVELVFDSGLGVYVVVGWPDYYWHNNYYYRWNDGGWMISARLDGGWATCSDRKVPGGLAKKQVKKAKGKKDHWKHPASRGR